MATAPGTLWSTPTRGGGSYPPDSFWRSLFYFSIYRIGVGCVFLLAVAFFGSTIAFGSHDLRLFYYGSIGYVVFGAGCLVLVSWQWPRFNLQLGLQVLGDAFFISAVMFSSGGVQSGVGLLLLPSLAGAGLISRGRLTLFFASLASVGVLLQESYGMLRYDAPTSQFLQAGLLCMGYFATAWLAHMLAKYAAASERLAVQRGIDLASMEQVNQLVIQDMQDGVLVVDGSGRVRQFNGQAQRLLGIPPGAPPGMELADCLATLAERFDAWRANEGTRFDLLRVPATQRLVRTRFVAIGDGERVGAVLFLEDMSRVQAQAQQLKLAALGRLTANIAHEIRNPLSAISHAAELLEEDRAGDPGLTRLVEIVRQNARRLDRMVTDVLQLNRRDRARPETFHPAGFLRGFIEEFCHGEKVPASAFALQFDTDSTVCFDRGHLNQVLWNLCRNAWRHGQRGRGSVRIRVSDGATPNRVLLDVIDDGPGIELAVRNQLFEPFFTTAPGGTGLGLFIAREICEANGAALDCLDSDAGAHFRILCMREHVKAQRASDAIP